LILCERKVCVHICFPLLWDSLGVERGHGEVPV